MDVKCGYRQTEVGLIPEVWETRTIGESMRLINGRAFKPTDWKDRGLPIIRIQNLNDTNIGFNYYSGPVDDRHRIEAEDLLFAWSGTTGTSFGARVWNGPAGVLNQHIFKVIPDQKIITSGYALLVLRNVQDHIERQAHGFKASFVHVKKADLVGIQLPIPPTKAEQEAIVEVLSDADALIESLEQLLVKKRQLKQGAMQELLTGKKRLPGFEVKPGYKQTEVGVIPEDWEVKSVHEFATIKTGPFGTLLKASEYSESHGVPLISVGEIREGFFRITDQTPRVSGTITRRLPQYVLRRGDIVFGRKGGVARSALIRGEQEGWFLGSDGISIRPSRDCHDEFLALQFQSARVQDWLLQNAIGTTMPSLNQEILRNVAIPLPSTKAEQETIANILFDMGSEIATLDAKLAKIRSLKQGMMQELLTGRIRLV